jgi:uroporphyrinogen decarboxylase
MCSLNLEEPDRVPVTPLIGQSHASKVALRPVSASFLDAEKHAKVIIAARKRYEYDWCFIGPGIEFESYGILMRLPENDSPSIVKPAILKPEDLDKYTAPNPNEDAKIGILINTIRELKKKVDGEFPVNAHVAAPYSFACMLRGVQDFCKELYTNRSFVKRLIALAGKMTVDYGVAQIEAGADWVWLGDALSSPNVISPQMHREFALPAAKAAVSEFKKRGVPVIYHVCGNTTKIFESMADTGADGISIEEAVDLSDAKARVGDRVCLMGNLDGVGLLLRGTPQDVKKATEACISKAGSGGGLMLSSGDETPRDCPSENIDAIVQVAETFGRYSRI